MYNTFCCSNKDIGLSPNGKALDSDSSISRFESLQPSERMSQEHLLDDLAAFRFCQK